MTQPVSVLLVDDHAMFRDALRRTLADERDIRVLATVANADEALVLCATQPPDVVLMDIDMPGTTCFTAAKEIQTACPGTRIVFLSAFFNDRYIERAIEIRAWGYVVKSEPAATVVMAIRRVAAGETYFSPEVQARLIMDGRIPRLAAPRSARISTLTEREIEILRYLARGMGQKQIAHLLEISANTVHRHVSSVMTKLDIHDRVEVARFAIREGLAEA